MAKNPNSDPAQEFEAVQKAEVAYIQRRRQSLMSVVPGETVQYEFVVRKLADLPAAVINLINTFSPAILEQIEVTPAGKIDPKGGKITWDIADLAVGAERTFTVKTKVKPDPRSPVTDIIHSCGDCRLLTELVS